MATIGARLAEVGPGRVVIELPYRADLTQQDGFIHAGISSTIEALIAEDDIVVALTKGQAEYREQRFI